MTTNRKPPEDRRGALLEEAARQFGTKGYENTSMRDIATAFGVLPGSLYHHFKSKDELFVAVYSEGVDRIIAAVEKAVGRHDDPWERLEAACVAHLQTLLGKRTFAATVVSDWPGTSGDLREELVKHRDRYEALFRGLVDAVAVPMGTDPRYLRLGLFGALNWTLTWYRPGRQSPASVARRLLALFRPKAGDRATPAMAPDVVPGAKSRTTPEAVASPVRRARKKDA